MGNLGRYQDIVTQAKNLGGVANLIKTIESGAVSKAAPGMHGKGVTIGAAIMLGVAGVKRVGEHLWATHKVREAAAAEARQELKDKLDDLTADRDRSEEQADSGKDGQPQMEAST